MERKTTNGFFSPRRFGQLLLRDLAGGYRGILIAMAAVAGVVILLSGLTALIQAAANRTATGGNFHGGFFIELLFFGGFIITSLTFREARQNGSAIFYMTLPASAFEKLVSKLLVTTVGFAVGSLVFFTATAAASEGLNRLVFGVGHEFFNPFDPRILRAVGLYLILQSVFLLGSIWFKKTAFVKTALSVACLVLGVAIFSGIMARIILAGHMVPTSASHGMVHMGALSLNWTNEFLEGIFGPGGRGYAGLMAFKLIGQILFFGLLAPVCWLASYFRLREVEV